MSIVQTKFTPNDIGEKSQAAILAEIVKNGYTVLLPFGEARRYDMVFEKNNLFFRVQCKTGRYMNGVIRFNTCSVNWWNKKRKKYTREEIDYFAVYCQYTEKVYLIPVEEVATNEGYLRVEPTANNQEKGVRWAKEYEV